MEQSRCGPNFKKYKHNFNLHVLVHLLSDMGKLSSRLKHSLTPLLLTGCDWLDKISGALKMDRVE